MNRDTCEHFVPVELSCDKCQDIEDIILWPDDMWCYRYELAEMTHKSDDYLIIKYGTKEHEAITLV